LLSPVGAVERSVQIVKGGFSFAAKRAFSWKGGIWQAGFSDHRIREERDWDQHIAYIAKNAASLGVQAYRFCGQGELCRYRQPLSG
jgi:putative transposase